jgi:hypothetical protein
MRLRRVAVSAFLLGLGIYILLPTADEIVINPSLGFPLLCIEHKHCLRRASVSYYLLRNWQSMHNRSNTSWWQICL